MSKLYAKVKSEKAEKGQGGNSFIEIELRTGTAKQSEIEHVIFFTEKGLWIDGRRFESPLVACDKHTVFDSSCLNCNDRNPTYEEEITSI